VRLLGVARILDALRWWDNAPILLAVVVVASVVALGTLGGAVAGALGALLYDASTRAGGGITIELEPLEPEESVRRVL
jgi:energy-converting hydrogenase Eha subunit G